MDQRTRIELTMMSLELRLAARGPTSLVGQRLVPQRLEQIARALDRVLCEDDAVPVGRVLAANDKAPVVSSSSVPQPFGRRR